MVGVFLYRLDETGGFGLLALVLRGLEAGIGESREIHTSAMSCRSITTEVRLRFATSVNWSMYLSLSSGTAFRDRAAPRPAARPPRRRGVDSIKSSSSSMVMFERALAVESVVVVL